MKRPWSTLLLVGALLGAAALARGRFGPSLDPQQLVGELSRAGEAGWALPLYVLLCGLTSLLAPMLVFLITAGAVWGFWPGALYGWLAATLWSQGQFWVGRWVGGARVRAFLERRQMKGVLAELEHGGVLAAIIVRQLPLPFVGVNLAAGASPIKWARWTLGNSLGLLPSVTVYAYSAASLLSGAQGDRQTALLRTVAAAAAIITLGLGARLAQRAVRTLPKA